MIALHNDPKRYATYEGSPLGLSDLGRALLHGENELFRQLPQHFWWGGILLTESV